MDQAKELLEMPREFMKDGRQFITRCSKRTDHTILPKDERILIVPYSGQARVHKNQPGSGNGILDHGRDWVHCEVEYVYR